MRHAAGVLTAGACHKSGHSQPQPAAPMRARSEPQSTCLPEHAPCRPPKSASLPQPDQVWPTLGALSQVSTWGVRQAEAAARESWGAQSPSPWPAPSAAGSRPASAWPALTWGRPRCCAHALRARSSSPARSWSDHLGHLHPHTQINSANPADQLWQCVAQA